MILCCRGWKGLVCYLDQILHSVGGRTFSVSWICDWHDRLIMSEFDLER